MNKEKITFWEKIKYFFWHCQTNIKEFFLNIKHIWQRATRGYDDTAYWGLDSYLANIALPVLKFYRTESLGLPFNNETNKVLTEKEWHDILDKMILAFQYIIEEEFSSDPNTYLKHKKKIDEGLQEFAKYYIALWD